MLYIVLQASTFGQQSSLMLLSAHVALCISYTNCIVSISKAALSNCLSGLQCFPVAMAGVAQIMNILLCNIYIADKAYHSCMCVLFRMSMHIFLLQV